MLGAACGLLAFATTAAAIRFGGYAESDVTGGVLALTVRGRFVGAGFRGQLRCRRATAPCLFATGRVVVPRFSGDGAFTGVVRAGPARCVLAGLLDSVGLEGLYACRRGFRTDEGVFRVDVF